MSYRICYSKINHITEQSYKPGYVLRDHLSRTAVTCSLKRSTRKRDGPPHGFLSDLASDGVYMDPPCYQDGGSLLHCLFTLTRKSGRYISAALSRESPPPDVIRHPALRSPDFPHPEKLLSQAAITCLAHSFYKNILHCL